MLNRILPQPIDNTYRGQKLALWLLGVLAFMKIAMGANTILNGRTVARTADGIPVDTFAPDAAQAVVSMFALLGLFHVIFGLVCVLALIRYRAMVPLVFALLLVEQLGRKLILQLIPIIRTGNPPGFIVNLVFLALMVVGLALSLWRRSS